ncbi:MarR family transcriptional regulator [Listeria sp. FSL L7-1582]|uniref:MarR family transcriptional regulator n=1 Tax=Listeria rustica TaxID=2713503 RepID=A0A7W1YG96_9LIST|nr:MULTISPECIES: MarR family transcriptional regulator [Listeria]MBA3926403.1 MarR family transcriptional regulator [Listeria rustica]MBC6310169.1 MarR family transcriptional regulator [Listeria portnoyi]
MVKKEQRLGVLLWFRLSRFYNRNIKLTNQNLKKANLSMAQFDVIAQIGLEGESTQKSLADRLVVTKGNITQLLVKLEEQGLICRRKQGKEKYIALTELGKACYLENVPAQEAFQQEQFGKLTRDEQKQLLSLLKKLDD